MDRELWRRGASELGALIRKREVSSREVVDAHLARIEQVNPAVNAITVTLAEAAQQAADRADRALAAGDAQAKSPLHGVPFTVKENIDLTGSATTLGIVAFASVTPDRDAPHISQLKAAGAIPLARTNLPDFAFRWHTDNALRGPTKNPWDPGRTPGGSSGGEAAALATGMTPLGIGNDYAGSLRVPAQFCGVASLRPTLGRVPQATAFEPGDMPITVQLMAVQGPMARRVADVRLAYDHMCGSDARDPWWTPAPRLGPPLNRRVALWRGGDDPQVDSGVEQAAEALADAGYELVDSEPPRVDEAARLWLHFATSDSRELVGTMRPVFGEATLAFLDLFIATEPALDLSGYRQALTARQGVARAWTLFQQDCPLVLGPACTRRPFPVNPDRDRESPEGMTEVIDSMRLTVLVNVLGLPSAAVPVGVAEDLPQGVQLIGPRYREDICLEAAEAIEALVDPITPIDMFVP